MPNAPPNPDRWMQVRSLYLSRSPTIYAAAAVIWSSVSISRMFCRPANSSRRAGFLQPAPRPWQDPSAAGSQPSRGDASALGSRTRQNRGLRERRVQARRRSDVQRSELLSRITVRPKVGRPLRQEAGLRGESNQYSAISAIRWFSSWCSITAVATPNSRPRSSICSIPTRSVLMRSRSDCEGARNSAANARDSA